MSTILVCQVGCKAGTRVPIGVGTFLIGRDDTCHLRSKSLHVSPRHCAIIRRDGAVVVRDFKQDGHTGTYVNERRVHGECRISYGDKLQVGPLVFTLQTASRANALADAKLSRDAGVNTADDTEHQVLRVTPPDDADVLLAEVPGWPAAATLEELRDAAQREESPGDLEGDGDVLFGSAVAYVCAAAPSVGDYRGKSA